MEQPDGIISKNADPKYLRKFTRAQVEERIRLRGHIPDYRRLLMECSVRQDDTGVWFDISNPSWTALVKLVQITDSESPAEARLNTTVMPLSNPSNDETDGPLVQRASHHDRASSEEQEAVFSPPVRPTRATTAPSETDFDLEAELSRPKPRTSVLRRSVRPDVDINHANRGPLWAALLGCKGASAPADLDPELMSCKFDLVNQRVIRLDVERTRPDLELFRDENVRRRLEIVLTVYCKRHLIGYKQGLNYLCAPFVVVFGVARLDNVYNCFAQWIRRFCPNTFTDDDFGGLQCLFRMFALLLQYHDPKLFAFLDENEMTPELYASPWFVTLFANRLEMLLVLSIWDRFLLHGDSLMPYFFCLSFLISRRDELLSYSGVVLPEKLSQLSLRSNTEVRDLFKLAEGYFSLTPESYLSNMRHIAARNVVVDSPLYRAVSALQFLPVAPEEIVAHCFAKEKHQFPLKYFVIDCRTASHYHSGHLPLAYHLNPSLYLHPEILSKRVDVLATMKGCHFCFVADASDTQYSQSYLSLMHFFVSRGFAHISICQGGFAACHDITEASGGALELVDHKTSKCLHCTKQTTTSHRKNLFTSMKDRLTGTQPTSPQEPAKLRRPDSVSGSFLRFTDAELDEIADSNSFVIVNAGSKGKSSATRKDPLSPTTGQDVPPNTTLIPQTAELHLFHTALRDQAAHSTPRTPEHGKHGQELYSACADRVVSMLLGAALERMKEAGETSERIVSTASDGPPFLGISMTCGLVGVGLSPGGQKCLEQALRPLAAVARVHVGRLQIDESPKNSLHTDNSARFESIPDANHTGSCRLLVFIPIILCGADVTRATSALRRRGHVESSIYIAALVGERRALWEISQIAPHVHIIVSAVDELDAHGRLSPGFVDFYAVYRSNSDDESVIRWHQANNNSNEVGNT